MRAKINNTELYFDVVGEGLHYDDGVAHEKPVMFCLHGGPGGDHSTFKQYCAELADQVQLVMMDHRGSGRSARGDSHTYTLANNVDDIEALRQYLGLDKIIVYGHSYGGMVAQGYALKYPGAVDKLILGVTVSDYRFFELAHKNLPKRAINDAEIVWGEKLLTTGFCDDAELREYFKATSGLYSNKARKEGSNVKAFDAMIVSHECINNGFQGFLREMNFTPDLHTISCPTLVFAGQDDWVCDPSLAKVIADEIPNATFVLFENSGHSVPADEHEAYIDMLRQFIAK